MTVHVRRTVVVAVQGRALVAAALSAGTPRGCHRRPRALTGINNNSSTIITVSALRQTRWCTVTATDPAAAGSLAPTHHLARLTVVGEAPGGGIATQLPLLSPASVLLRGRLLWVCAQ